MQRRLILMRHAKSDWKDRHQRDHERPLNKRGRRSAPMVAWRLIELEWIPDQIVSSDAVRAQQTASLVREQLPDAPPLTLERDLYQHGAEALPILSERWSEALGTVLVVGHNPTMETLVMLLTGTPVSMTTANAALLSLPESDSWSEALACRKMWELEGVIRPRELEGL